jgi:hypothetical protein
MYLQDYAESRAAVLADVLPAPQPSTVQLHGAANVDALRSQSAAQTERAGQEAFGQTATGIGQSEQLIDADRRALAQQAENDRTLAAAGVSQGSARVRDDGEHRRREVSDEIESPALLGQALDGAGRVLPNTDRFSDLLRDSEEKERASQPSR